MGDDNGTAIYWTLVSLVIVAIFIGGMMAGKADARLQYLNRCIEKNGDMPANKVKAYCKEQLDLNS